MTIHTTIVFSCDMLGCRTIIDWQTDGVNGIPERWTEITDPNADDVYEPTHYCPAHKNDATHDEYEAYIEEGELGENLLMFLARYRKEHA